MRLVFCNMHMVSICLKNEREFDLELDANVDDT
jgi:hypothetical protein